jgi:hypothetical protein
MKTSSLTISPSNSPQEQEADNMANNIMRMPEMPVAQRKCATCEHEEEKISRKTKPFIQKQGNGLEGGTASESVTNQINTSRGGGSKMPENTLSFMESRFGADFSDIKIHTDTNAVQMSRELNAQAFTVGRDIYFNSGKYAPDSDSGRHLLAHELTHTVQQGGGVDRKIQRACGDVAQNWYNPIIRISSFDPSCLLQYTNVDMNSIQNIVTPWSRNALSTGLFGTFAGMATTIIGRRLGLSQMAALVFGGVLGGARSYVGMTVKERIRGNTVNTHNWYGSYKYDAYNQVVLATNFHGIGPNTISLVAPWYFEEALFDADNNIIANYIHINEMDLPGINIGSHIPLPEYSFGTF